MKGAGNPINVMTGNKYQRDDNMPALPGVLGLERWRNRPWSAARNSAAGDNCGDNGGLGGIVEIPDSELTGKNNRDTFLKYNKNQDGHKADDAFKKDDPNFKGVILP